MNISVFSLIASSLFSYSPLFVGNRLSFVNGHFRKVSSAIFFNQNNLILKDSTFTQIYGTILHNSNENNHQTIKGEEYSSTKPFSIELSSIPQSITIQNCKFDGITNTADINNPFKIEDEKVSLYITDSLFNNCRSNDGVVYLKCRCFTMTHTCSTGSLCDYRHCFLYYGCKENDFSIILYNSIFDSKIGQENRAVTANMYFSYGDQYLKCNNMTQIPFNGFQFDNVQCFSFRMNTVNDADHSCLYFSGTQQSPNDVKNIEMANLKNNAFDNYALIRFSSHCTFKFSAVKSVLLTNGDVFKQENTDSQTVIIHIDNCILILNTLGAEVTNNNPTYANGVDTNVFFKIPHFTYEEYCKGTEIDYDVSVKACNVGNCEPEACGKTIGFPEGVVPYTSVFHSDIQAEFTQSNDFTESAEFSNSFDFSKSNEFLKTYEFSKSNDFSPSVIKNVPLDPTEDDKDDNDKDDDGKDDDKDDNDKDDDGKDDDKDDNDKDEDDKGNGSNKNNKGETIGIIVGVVAGVAIIAIIVAIVLIKKKQKMNMPLSDGDVISHDTCVVTVDNALQKEMDNDDPFAVDFQIENL